MILELAKKLFQLFWRAGIRSGLKIQVSDKYQEEVKQTSEIPELLEMFGEQFLGRPLHLCLRQLYFRMPNDVSCALLIERRIEEYVTFWWRGNGVCWDIGTCFRYNGQGTARRALSLLGYSLSAGYLAFSANSNISKSWCVIADERIVCWWRIFDRLSAFADCWG